MTKPISRRTLVRNLATLSAVSAVGANPLLMHAQTALSAVTPNPYPQDVTIFLIGPWLLFSQAPGRPSSMLAMTADDPVHEYVQGVFTGARPSDPLPLGEHVIKVTSPEAPVVSASSLLTGLNQEMLCIDNSTNVVSPSALADGANLRKVYLPVPDEMIPVVYLAPTAGTSSPPLFQWPDKPMNQVMPERVTTAMVLRYRNATSLSVGGKVVASMGDHYHLETRVQDKMISSDAEHMHAMHFARKLAGLLTYAGKPLDLTYDPGQDARIVAAKKGIDPVEVGVNPKVMLNRAAWNPGDRPRLLRTFASVGDCSVPLVAVADGSTVPCSSEVERLAGSRFGVI